MSHNLQGVILSITPYQESSAMVHLLSKDYGLLRFVLQGFYKPTSKMQNIGMPFSEVIYRTDYKENRLLKCYGGELLHSYTAHREQYDWLVWMSLLAELIIKNYDYIDDAALYEMVIDNLNALHFEKILRLMSAIIINLGIAPYLSGCVVCDDHRIHGFSISLGGFTCQEHTEVKGTYEMLVLLGQLFNQKEIQEDQELQVAMIHQLIAYLEFHTNIKYHSNQLL